MSTSTDMDTPSETNNDVAPPSTSQPTRRVRFPSDESKLRMISIAPEPFANQPLLSLGVILQRYRASCQRLQIRPLNSLLDQLGAMEDFRRSYDDRLACLKLSNEKLDMKQMDAIEEILSRARFHTLDLESAVYDDSILIQLLDVIEYYETCTHLNLSNHRAIGTQGYQALTRYLRKTHCLERLDMNSTRFDEGTMFSFGRALRLAGTLYELHVESCQLNGSILRKFIANLRACPTLRELYLGDNRLQVQDAPLINELIRSCGRNLRLLDLRSNSLQDSGISHVASQLSQYGENNTDQNSISHISFQANQLTQNGISFLAKCLIHNRTIRSLNLSHNNLMNEGLFILRDALLNNRTINEIMLRNCRLTDQAAIALAEFIAESTTIQYIDLRENNIQASGICGLAIALKTNRSLLRLDVDSLTSSTNSSSNYNIDRPNTSSSVLSFSGLRKVTASLGGFTSNSNLNGNSSANNPELIEQKTRWINDINMICERNILIYQENLRRQQEEEEKEEEKQKQLQSSSSNIIDSANGNGVEEHLSSTDSSPDIVIDEFDKGQIETLVKVEEPKDLNPENNDDYASLSRMEPILESPTLEQPNVQFVSNHLEKSGDDDLLKSNTDDNAIQPTSEDNTDIVNHNQIDVSDLNENEILTNGTKKQVEEIVPEIPIVNSSFTLVDETDEIPVNADDEQETKRKLRHSDSLHLLRRKTQYQANSLIDELSSNASSSSTEDQTTDQC